MEIIKVGASVKISNEGYVYCGKEGIITKFHEDGCFDLELHSGQKLERIPGRDLKIIELVYKNDDIKDILFSEKDWYMIAIAIELIVNEGTNCNTELNEYALLYTKVKDKFEKEKEEVK